MTEWNVGIVMMDGCMLFKQMPHNDVPGTNKQKKHKNTFYMQIEKAKNA